MDFWLYLGNKKSYQRSAGVKMTGFSRAFQLPAWVTRPEGPKDEVRVKGQRSTNAGAIIVLSIVMLIACATTIDWDLFHRILNE